MKIIVLNYRNYISVTGYVDVAGNLELPSSTIHSVISLPSVNTSAGHRSLPCGVTQTLIPEGSKPLVVLPGLGCSSFPST